MAFKAAGIPYTIVERNSEVGGTWLENRYSGAGVDTANHLYSWAGIRNDWKHYFSLRDEIQAYLERAAAESSIREHIRFDTDVELAVYDEPAQEWAVTVRTPRAWRCCGPAR